MAIPEVREPRKIENIKTAVAGNSLVSFLLKPTPRALLSHKSGNCFVAVKSKSGSRHLIVVHWKSLSSRRTKKLNTKSINARNLKARNLVRTAVVTLQFDALRVKRVIFRSLFKMKHWISWLNCATAFNHRIYVPLFHGLIGLAIAKKNKRLSSVRRVKHSTKCPSKLTHFLTRKWLCVCSINYAQI